MLKTYKKIGHEVNGGLVTCIFYDTATKDIKKIIVDDLEYNYGDGYINSNYTTDQLEMFRSMSIDGEALRQYKIDNNILFVGAEIEVIKGRKYKKGERGIITKIYDYNDCYGRFVATYCLTDNNMKINLNNVKMVN